MSALIIPIQRGSRATTAVTVVVAGRAVGVTLEATSDGMVVSFHDGRTWMPVRPSSAARARWTFASSERRVWEGDESA